MKKRSQSMTPMAYVLRALVPYTRQNMILSFKPNEFFNELEKLSGYSENTLRTTYGRAKRSHMFDSDGDQFTLSLKARQTIQPFVANKLKNGGKLMVIFDVPQQSSHVRRQLRGVLRQLGFIQIQQSVWITDKDYRDVIDETIEFLQAGDWVKMYEAAEIR